MATDRSQNIPYTPANPPAFSPDLVRSVWDEFYRIAAALNGQDRPVSLSATSSETLAMGPNPPWSRLFMSSQMVQWEAPPGALNGAGIWQAPSEGLYSMSVGLACAAGFPSPGEPYELQIRVTRHPVGGALITRMWSGGGRDDAATSRVYPLLFAARKGDAVYVDARAIQTGLEADLACASSLQVMRVSGVK